MFTVRYELSGVIQTTHRLTDLCLFHYSLDFPTTFWRVDRSQFLSNYRVFGCKYDERRLVSLGFGDKKPLPVYDKTKG